MIKTSIKLYQIYYNESQKETLNKNCIPYFNDKLTVYFENKIILDLQDEICNCKYFGVVSHKFEQKNEMIIPFNEIENSNFDIYCLGGKSIFRHNVYQFARDTHGNIWSHLYRKMLVDVLCEGDEKTADNLIKNINVGIYQNAILATPEVYNLFINSMLKSCVKWMEENKSIQQFINSECKYIGGLDKSVLQKNGIKHYTFHTFLLERLWSVFIHVNENNFKIKI